MPLNNGRVILRIKAEINKRQKWEEQFWKSMKWRVDFFDIVEKIDQSLAKLCTKDQKIRYRNEEIRADAHEIQRIVSMHICIQPDWKPKRIGQISKCIS